MTVEKNTYYIRYPEDEKINCEIKLNRVAEESGNYLIHRDILRHQLSQKQGTVATKTRSEVRGGGKKLGNKKVQVELGQDQAVLHYGEVVVLSLGQNLKQLS